MMPLAMTVGDRYGRLVVIEITDQCDHKRRRLCRFQCDCGQVVLKPGRQSNMKTVRSCGCLRRESAIRSGRLNAPLAHLAQTKHGCSRARARESGFNIWQGMWQRCTNSKVSQFPNYGGRGIRVCDRWEDFETFVADVGPRPSLRHSIDRYPDKNGNYEPGNVRWALPVQQANNRREAKLRTLKTHCVRGHAFDEENAVPLKNGRGRKCRQCKRIHWTRANEKRKLRTK